MLRFPVAYEHGGGVLTVGSLFAGIGGFDLGFERAGMRTAWQVELDPFCRAVLARHFPGAERHTDVREVGSHNLAPVDVVCGGFPCQDISTAGTGAGIDGERSGLWSEYARIVGELRPRYVVVENVAALLARGLDRVVGDLAAIGYDAEWDCIPAIAVGAPHRRDRLWLIAYPQGSGREARLSDGLRAIARSGAGSSACAGGAGGVADAEGEPEWAGLRTGEPREERRGRLGDGSSALGDPEGDGRRPGRQGRPDPAGEGQREPERPLQDADERALQPWRVGGRAAQAGGPEWWAVEPPVGRVAHGVPNRLDQLAALGNALVPQIAEWLGRRILDYEGSRVTA